MKKIFILMLLLVMTFSFAACEGSKKEEASTQAVSEDATVDETTDNAEADTTEADTAAADTAAADTTEADQATDDKALEEADYNQLLTIVEDLNAHRAMMEQLVTYREQYDAGELTIEDLTKAYQEIPGDSQRILDSVKGATWNTETYNSQITLLTETLEALAQAEALNSEAITNNDEAKLTEADTYTATYNEKLDAFLTAMGV